MVILQIDFPHEGPFGDEMAEAVAGLANSIVEEPGFIWKIWTENKTEKEGGGIYLFQDENQAKAYLEKHSKRLEGFGVSKINAKIFQVNESLSIITKGPIT